MSDKISIVGTKFENLDGSNTSYGYRIYGDNFMSYDNSNDEPITEDFELLSFVIENGNDEVQSVLRDNESMNTGFEINGTWYDWDEIKHLF